MQSTEEIENKLPEKNLLVAILRRALFDYFGRVESEKLAAKEWLFDAEAVNDEFSFEWVCEQLGNDANEIRNRISTIKRLHG